MKRVKYIFLFLLLSWADIGFAQSSSADFAAELAKTENSNVEAEKKKAAAFTMLETVQKAGNYVNSLLELISDKRIPLPVGVKSEAGGYELIVHEIYPDRQTRKARIYATCAFRFKDTNQPIVFEGDATLESLLGFGHGHLTLIAPVRRNIGRQSAIVVREGTSVGFSCNGIEDFDAKLAWVTTSDKIIAVDAQGSPTHQPIGVYFDAHFGDFDNYLVSLDVNQRFMYKGLDDVIFTLRGAVIDQSDTENSGMMQFPQGYFSGASAGTQKLWKGVAVSEASVILPAFFKKPNGSEGERLTLSFNQTLDMC